MRSIRWFYLLVASIVLSGLLIGFQRVFHWTSAYIYVLVAILLAMVAVSLVGFLSRLWE